MGKVLDDKIVLVSIHAPVMGAKIHWLIPYAVVVVSIHAPVMGAKLALIPHQLAVSFNPRTRDGCEDFKNPDYAQVFVSIHAPVMGANTLIRRHIPFFCFNPRTRDGCEDPLSFGIKADMFQSTHP